VQLVLIELDGRTRNTSTVRIGVRCASIASVAEAGEIAESSFSQYNEELPDGCIAACPLRLIKEAPEESSLHDCLPAKRVAMYLSSSDAG
jgi:hypothetical protein